MTAADTYQSNCYEDCRDDATLKMADAMGMWIADVYRAIVVTKGSMIVTKPRHRDIDEDQEDQEKGDLSLNINRFKPRGQIYIGSYDKDLTKEWNPKRASITVVTETGDNQ